VWQEPRPARSSMKRRRHELPSCPTDGLLQQSKLAWSPGCRPATRCSLLGPPLHHGRLVAGHSRRTGPLTAGRTCGRTGEGNVNQGSDSSADQSKYLMPLHACMWGCAAYHGALLPGTRDCIAAAARPLSRCGLTNSHLTGCVVRVMTSACTSW
jgi:hypothetical protein